MLALSVCPLRGSQLPQRGSQGVLRLRNAKLQFIQLLTETDKRKNNEIPLLSQGDSIRKRG